MIVEVVGSVMSGSLGLLAHAAHMLTDAVAVSLALFAMWIAEGPSTITRTYGYHRTYGSHRTEVLVVLFNALALWVLAASIAYQAYLRITEHAHGHHHEVDGGIMVVVAGTGWQSIFSPRGFSIGQLDTASTSRECSGTLLPI
jgi:cobalt-zinc-cadmium efflux system protein